MANAKVHLIELWTLTSVLAFAIGGASLAVVGIRLLASSEAQDDAQFCIANRNTLYSQTEGKVVGYEECGASACVHTDPDGNVLGRCEHSACTHNAATLNDR